jgi:hypothetical protein
MHRARRKSTPLLTQLVEPGSLQVVRAHDNPKLDIGLKSASGLMASRIQLNFEPTEPSFTAALNG